MTTNEDTGEGIVWTSDVVSIAGHNLNMPAIATDGTWTIGTTTTNHTLLSNPCATYGTTSLEDAAAYFKGLRPSLRERFVEDTEYVEAKSCLQENHYIGMLMDARMQKPTRFSSEELKKFHLEALIDEELRREG